MRGAAVLRVPRVIPYPISIHAPHAGSGKLEAELRDLENEFQSTLPMRGAADNKVLISFDEEISIHAPHAGSGDLFI